MMDKEIQTTLQPSQLILLQQGFGRIFWGILISLFFYFSVIQFKEFSHLPLPTYVLGALIIYWGLTAIYKAGTLTQRWSNRVRVCMLLVFLLVYFAPLIYLYHKQSDIVLYQINMLAFAFAAALTLYQLNRLASDFGRAIAHPGFTAEASVYAWMTLALMLPPLLFVGFVYGRGRIMESSSLSSSVHLPTDQLRWFLFMMLIPFTLTMACLWRARTLAIAQLLHQHETPENPS